MPSPKKPASKSAPKPAPKTAKALKPAPRPSPDKVPAKPVTIAPAPPPPPLTAADRAWLDNMRQTLLQRRAQLTNVVQSNREQLAANEGDPADIADRASEGFEDELTAGLLSLEVAALDEVDAALERIDKGDYGACVTCGKPISRKRLEILPFAKRCLKCEDEKERAIPLNAAADQDGEDEEEAADEADND
ncbi:MAG: TraR/DksA C4-type zinc finger protein [Phycisphaerae bacterium]